MLNQNWFMDERFEMFEDYEESQSFYDTKTKNIYIVIENNTKRGETIIQEITEESLEYKLNFERYKAFKNKNYHVKLIMSEEYDINASSPEEAETVARAKFGNDYYIDKVIITSDDTCKEANFINDKEKIYDFTRLSKEEFLSSYSYITEEEYDNTVKLYRGLVRKQDGYVFVSERKIEYTLLEGKSIKGDKEYTSDLIFIILLDDSYNVDNNIVGFLYGANVFEDEKDTYKESISQLVEEFEKRNFDKKEEKNMKEQFLEYINENFNIDTDGKKIIRNIIDWIWMQSMDKEDTINSLMLLLDGIGLKQEEIEKFIGWE